MCLPRGGGAIRPYTEALHHELPLPGQRQPVRGGGEGGCGKGVQSGLSALHAHD